MISMIYLIMARKTRIRKTNRTIGENKMIFIIILAICVGLTGMSYEKTNDLKERVERLEDRR